MEDASGTDHVRCGEGVCLSLPSPWKVVVEGESGRNELLRGTFALFGVRIGAKLVRDLAKHRRTPMSPTQLIPPTSPVQIFTGDGRFRRRFSHTGHGPFRALIVSNLKWGGPCRGHYVFPAGRYQTFRNSFIRAPCRHIVFPAHGSTEWPRQGPPPHLTRETFSGRRPADGADTPGGVFRSGENLALGRRGR
ncbi:Uncharacterised protein [[Clostridium] symbiosum]|uniref:Uncharacterized protein n=1 Tax=Clostridium symbiosum TaxID=1512 RepID=A0A6N3H9V9_CLOSY|nr:hypothetical protein HMPREF1020_03390 [Clostridium sp. 7_3_54FAA]